ncbi:hypothetical protein LLG95_17425 [bacterium]|nr:hypothetical protein [bacterium]
MNEAADAPIRKNRLKWILLVIALICVSPFVLFFSISSFVNSEKIPADMEKTPAEMETLRARVIEEAGKRPVVTGFPVARGSSAGKSYEDFLKSEKTANPGLDSVDIYNEILKRNSTPNDMEKLRNFDKPPVPPGRPDEPGWKAGKPLNEAAVAWLKANPELVELFVRLGESSGLPVRTMDQFAAPTFDPTAASIPSPAVVVYGVRVLAAEGQRRLEAGDAAGADRCWRAGARIALNIGAEPYDTAKIWGGGGMSAVAGAVGSWIANDGATPEQIAAWRKTLERFHAEVYPQNWYANWLRVAYPAMRKNAITSIKPMPWTSPFYGYDVDDPQKFRYYHADILGFDNVPRVDRILDTALRSIQYKHETPRLIAELDQYHAEVNQRAELSWPETVRAGEMAVPKNNPWLKGMQGDFSRLIKIYFLTHEAELNLTRALIEYESGAIPSFAKGVDYHSPWRDPFNETPLSMSTKDGETLLYSLGPDGVDQLGRVSYDQKNGMISAGDIVLGIGAKK